MEKHLNLVLIACLTIGLTPYLPEPHIWGKMKWVLGGAKGMTLLDWWDFVMHGTPWVILIIIIINKYIIQWLKANRLKTSSMDRSRS